MSNSTMARMFENMGYQYEKMDIGVPVDVSNLGYEVKGLNDTWVKVKKIIRKPATKSFLVKELDLRVSPMHLFYAKVANSEPHWVEAIALVGENVQLMSSNNEWVNASVIEEDRSIDILDIEVEGGEYITNGVLSHNTMFGDPTTTPGGKAIPFHSSVRIRLGAGQQITNKEKEVIGIHVWAKTIKNKVSPPFRKVEFEIHFGYGIKEHEQLFDMLRKHGEETVNGVTIECSGTSAWKTLLINDAETGEVIAEKKFYKHEFGDIISDPEYNKYIEDYIEAVMVKKMDLNRHALIDSENYEEIRQIAMDIDEVSPED